MVSQAQAVRTSADARYFVVVEHVDDPQGPADVARVYALIERAALAASAARESAMPSGPRVSPPVTQAGPATARLAGDLSPGPDAGGRVEATPGEP